MRGGARQQEREREKKRDGEKERGREKQKAERSRKVTRQIATGTTSEIIIYLKAQKIDFYCATLQDSVSYHTQDFTTPTAIVVGTEDTGLTEEWRENSTKNIIIPMQGEIDSMNVSVAAAILIFEAKRQRGFN